MIGIPTQPLVRDPSRSPFRTLVVDDSAPLLERLCRLLDAQPLIELVGATQQGRKALQLAEALRPDLVLMDLNMPLVDGLQATTILYRQHRHIRVILMSIDGSPKAQTSAQALGAHGFIWKPRIQSDLMTEIHRAFK